MGKNSKKANTPVLSNEDLEVLESIGASAIETVTQAQADQPADGENQAVEASEQAVVEAVEETPATDTVVRIEGDLKAMINEITFDQKEAERVVISNTIEDRIKFEKDQPGLSSKMIPNLEAIAKRMATIGAAGVLLACKIDPKFINREVSAGSRFNVYGLMKMNDLILGLDAGILQNAINRAVIMSMFNFRDADVPFTGEAAMCAVSDKLKADKAISKHLVRHTVSTATASTQKSSTMNALETLGIVVSNKLRGKNEVYTLTDTPQTRRLEAVLRPAA